MTHRYGDERIVEWLQEHGYHPRSDKHGDAVCRYLLDDLLYESEQLRQAAESGQVVYQTNYTVGSGALRWNVDLVLGPPTGGIQTEIGDSTIAEGEPATIWLAVDAKSIMTEHGKARRNRQRDINSFADIMYYHYEDAVTGGHLLINTAERFRSPLRDEDDITEHDNIERLVEETVELFREIDRADGERNSNVDAVGCVVVSHTNLGDETKLVTGPPAPRPGDIVHYEEFIRILLHTLEPRFLE